MKYVLFSLAVFLLAVSSIHAQSGEDIAPVLSDTFSIAYKERVVYEMFDIEQPPKYPGGEKELLKYLVENIKLPPMPKDTYIITSTAITFIVETDGSIVDKKVIRNDGPLAQSALKALEQMPRWSPGMKNGQPVAVRFTLPFRVRLE